MKGNFFDVEIKEKYINIKKYVFDFGKYDGTSIKEIIKTDPGYIIWCHENIGWFKLKNKDFKKIKPKADKEKKKYAKYFPILFMDYYDDVDLPF